jgi:hypothetical protein
VQRPAIIAVDIQAHPTATGDMVQPVHDVAESTAAEAAALLPAVQGEPAEPPAGRISAVGVKDDEAYHLLIDVNAEQLVRQAAANGGDNILDGSEETLRLLGFELDGGDGIGIGSADPMVAEGHSVP